jgi:hypothetical protein
MTHRFKILDWLILAAAVGLLIICVTKTHGAMTGVSTLLPTPGAQQLDPTRAIPAWANTPLLTPPISVPGAIYTLTVLPSNWRELMRSGYCYAVWTAPEFPVMKSPGRKLFCLLNAVNYPCVTTMFTNCITVTNEARARFFEAVPSWSPMQTNTCTI